MYSRNKGKLPPETETKRTDNYQPDPIYQSMQEWFKDYKLQKHLDIHKPKE
jgi:hypothetical protein